jgi:hypothetical protein
LRLIAAIPADKKRNSALWVSRAESAQEIHDKAYRQNQAKPTATDDGTAKVKPATTEQQEKNKYK